MDLSGATRTYWKLTANTVIGSGVDFNGNLWGIGHDNDIASRIDVDAAGNVTSTAAARTSSSGATPTPTATSPATG